MDMKRASIKSHTDLMQQITAAKPKAVFLDGKPTLDRRQFKLGKTNQIGIKEQGLQSIRRAAFATETNDEVTDGTYLLKWNRSRGLSKFDLNIFYFFVNRWAHVLSGHCLQEFVARVPFFAAVWRISVHTKRARPSQIRTLLKSYGLFRRHIHFTFGLAEHQIPHRFANLRILTLILFLFWSFFCVGLCHLCGHQSNKNRSVVGRSFRRISDRLSVFGEHSADFNCANDLDRNWQIHQSAEWLDRFWSMEWDIFQVLPFIGCATLLE